MVRRRMGDTYMGYRGSLCGLRWAVVVVAGEPARTLGGVPAVGGAVQARH